MSESRHKKPFGYLLLLVCLIGYPNREKIKKFLDFHLFPDAPRQVRVDSSSLLPFFLKLGEKTEMKVKINKTHPHLRQQHFVEVSPKHYNISIKVHGQKGGLVAEGHSLHGKKKGWYQVSLEIKNKPEYNQFRFSVYESRVIGVGFSRNPWNKINVARESPELRFLTKVLRDFQTRSTSVTRASGALFWSTSWNFVYNRRGTPPWHSGYLKTQKTILQAAFKKTPMKIGRPVLCHHGGAIYMMGGSILRGNKEVENRRIWAFELKNKRWKTIKPLPNRAKARFAFSHPIRNSLAVLAEELGQLSLYLFDADQEQWKREATLGNSQQIEHVLLLGHHLLVHRSVLKSSSMRLLFRVDLNNYSRGSVVAPAVIPGKSQSTFDDLFVFNNQVIGQVNRAYESHDYYRLDLPASKTKPANQKSPTLGPFSPVGSQPRP